MAASARSRRPHKPAPVSGALYARYAEWTARLDIAKLDADKTTRLSSDVSPAARVSSLLGWTAKLGLEP
jgi:hypothetical protein